eukprot:61913_1
MSTYLFKMLLYLAYILCIYGNYIIHDNVDYHRIPHSSNQIGVIDILDEIYIEFYITIHSFNSSSKYSRSSILHFGNNVNEKYPSIYINDLSQSIVIEFTSVSNNTQSWQYSINTNTIYHIQITATQTNIMLTVNNIPIVNESITSHSILFNRNIYISNPWNNPCNCIIKGLTVTTDNSINQPFNYLCDYINRFTNISGDWTYDPNTCILTQNDYTLDKASIWMGDADINTLLWTNYSIEIQFMITYNGGSGSPDSMITLRQTQYLNEYGVFLEAISSSPLGMLLFDNDQESSLFRTSISINTVLNQLYKLRVDVTGNKFDIYVNDNLEQTQIDSTHSIGSIGLRTFSAIAQFHSLHITFPNNGKLYTMNPSISPTQIPSQTPTRGPTTTLPPIVWDVTGYFSDSYLQIYVDLINNNDNNNLLIYGNFDTCDDIFLTVVNNTQVDLLEGATCVFTDNSNQIKNVDIIISLSSLSTVGINHSNVKIFLKTGSFHYYRIEDNFRNGYMFNEYSLSFNPITAKNALSPIISISFASIIGSCDNIYVDARGTTMLGGRSANFTWNVRNIYPNNTNIHLPVILLSALDENILSNINMDVLSTLEIELIVESWFGGKSIQIFNISKVNDALPVLILTATPNIFSKSNKNYDKIGITSLITFNNTCINDNDVIPFLAYSVQWSVSSSTTNTAHLNMLKIYLDTLKDDNIFIPSSYMLPGNMYIFELELHCSNCISSSSTVIVHYEYSKIQCQIGSSDKIFLESISINQMNSFQLPLDGDIFTFDYDQPSINNKSNLLWNWSCNKKPSDNDNVTTCDSLLTEFNSKQLILFKNESFLAHKTYIYQFIMSVSDLYLHTRESCTDSLTLIVDIIPNTDATDLVNILSVSISAISKIINRNERVRLIVDITNWNENGKIVSFNWTETTDLLEMKNINILNGNTENSGNLILSENTLISGNIYEFELFVT